MERIDINGRNVDVHIAGDGPTLLFLHPEDYFSHHGGFLDQLAKDFRVIAPRHPERGPAVAALAGGAPRRANGVLPYTDDSVYVADTMGELGGFYAAAGVALIAGSLLPHLKGHNPVEALQCGAATLTGPHVESFADVVADLDAAGAIEIVPDAASIAAAVARLWAAPDVRAARAKAGRAALAHGGDALAATLDLIMPLLPAERSADARA